MQTLIMLVLGRASRALEKCYKEKAPSTTAGILVGSQKKPGSVELGSIAKHTTTTWNHEASNPIQSYFYINACAQTLALSYAIILFKMHFNTFLMDDQAQAHTRFTLEHFIWENGTESCTKGLTGAKNNYACIYIYYRLHSANRWALKGVKSACNINW